MRTATLVRRQSDVLLANKYKRSFWCGDSCPQYWRELWWWAIRSVPSLRDLVLHRLGKRTPSSPPPISFAAGWGRACAGVFALPLIAFAGLVTHEASGRRAAGVQIYGVDERFWRFHGTARRKLPAMSAALAQELGSKPGDPSSACRKTVSDSTRSAARRRKMSAHASIHCP